MIPVFVRALLPALLLVSFVARSSARPAGYVRSSIQIGATSPYSEKLLLSPVLVGSFYAEFDHDLYVRSRCQPDPKCSRPTIASCCQRCPDEGDAGNQKGCFCPPVTSATCLDMSSPNPFPGYLSFANASLTFAVGLLPDGCQDIAVAVLPRVAVLILRPGDPAQFTEVVRCSEHPRGRWIEIAIDPNAPFLGVSFSILLLETSASHPLLVLPMAYFYKRICFEEEPTLSCPGNAPLALGARCSYPTDDPALAWLNEDLLALDVFRPPLPNNIISFNVLLSEDDSEIGSSAPPDFPANTVLTDCRLSLSGFCDVNGTSYPAETLSFAPQLPTCTSAQLAPILDGLDAYSLALDTGVSTGHLSSLLASNPWVGCSNLLSSLLVPETSLSIANWTGCNEAVGSPSYLSDPCCNATAALSKCCLPRTEVVNVTRWSPNADAIQALCRTPACTLGFLQSNVAGLSSLSPVACQQQVLDLFADPRLSGSFITECAALEGATVQMLPLPCTTAADCPLSGVCEPNPLFVATSPVAALFPLTQPVCKAGVDSRSSAYCVISGVHPLSRLYLMSLVGLPSDTSDAVLLEALLANFTSTSCVSQVDGSLGFFNASSPTDPCACEACGACNWNPTLPSRQECSDSLWRGDHFCSVGYGCEWGGPACVEVSRFPGCFYHFGPPLNRSRALCEAAGGQPVTGHSPPELDCWFSSAQSSQTCLPPDFCFSSHLRPVPAMNQTWCDSYCVLTLNSSALCSCSNTRNPVRCRPHGLAWDSSLSQCLLLAPRDALEPTCRAVGGVYWPGAFWQEPLFADEVSCSSRGLCTSDPAGFVDMATAAPAHASTAAECAALIGCDLAAPNSSACLSLGLCSAALTTDVCMVPVLSNPASGTPFCTVYSAPYPLIPGLGCQQPDASGPVACESQSGNWSSQPPPRVSNVTCLQAMGCLQPLAQLLSQKEADACAACGGQMRPQAAWFAAKWGRGQHVPFAWRPRAWTSPFTPKPVFNLLPLSFDASPLIDPAGIEILALTQLVLCQQQLQVNVLPLIAADCGLDAAEQSYSLPSLQRAAQTIICAGTPSAWWPVPDGYSPSFGLISSGGAELMESGLPCTSVSVSLAQRALFARASSSPFSSLMLSTLHLDEYLVTRNAAGVPVLQLRSDVTEILLGPGLSAAHATFCLCDKGGPALPVFSVPDFASFDPSNATFTPLFLSVYAATIPGQCTAICINGTSSGTRAAVMRAPDPAIVTWAQLLTPPEANIFLAATVLFSGFAALTLVRLGSLGFARLRSRQTAPRLALLQLALLGVACLLRAVLFGLLWAGSIPFEATVSLFVLAELPTMLEFSLAAFFVYSLAEAYHGETDPSAKAGRGSRLFLVTTHALLATILTSVLTALAVLGPLETSGAACAAPAYPPQAVLDRAYKVMVALLAAALGCLVVGYGRVDRARMTRHGVAGCALWQFTAVCLATSVGLLTQAALVLCIAFEPGTPGVLIGGAVAELLRPAALLLTARPSGWREDWCFGLDVGKRDNEVVDYVMQDDEY